MKRPKQHTLAWLLFHFDLVTATPPYLLLPDHLSIQWLSGFVTSKKKFSFFFQVYLHAEESWAETAAHSHWLVKSSWWRPKKLVVEEVMGTKRYVKHFSTLVDHAENLDQSMNQFPGVIDQQNMCAYLTRANTLGQKARFIALVGQIILVETEKTCYRRGQGDKKLL